MPDQHSDKVCVVIGASHAGVNFAFSLRAGGWPGEIILFDSDPMMPYHRPPLSKSYLTKEQSIEKSLLRSAESYNKAGITLHLGVMVKSIHRDKKYITLEDGRQQTYDKLVLATGARALIPSIPGLDQAKHVFTLRTIDDVNQIQAACQANHKNRVVIIGGGYIGLEIAASLKKLGASVTVLEREDRVLARVTTPDMSLFFQNLHAQNGVQVLTGKNVVAVNTTVEHNELVCSDNTSYPADLIIIGVGIRVNKELAEDAGLEVKDGIVVNSQACTNDQDIYATGDNTYHYNPHYDRHIRLECLQNAIDQAKVAAASICGKNPTYDKLPWFWSDQFDVKLQIAGLSEGHDRALVRVEEGEDKKFSIWYFKGDELLAVDAINHAKAYVLGTKFIKNHQKLDQSKLMDPRIELKPANILIE